MIPGTGIGRANVWSRMIPVDSCANDRIFNDIPVALRICMLTMKLAVLVLAIASFLPVAQGCDDDQPLRADLLARDWRHSYEEDSVSSRVQTFRPAGSRMFSASRFRMEYIFMANGECKWLELMPNDGHRLRNGIWWFSALRGNVVYVDVQQRVDSFQIVELGTDVLRLRQLN